MLVKIQSVQFQSVGIISIFFLYKFPLGTSLHGLVFTF